MKVKYRNTSEDACTNVATETTIDLKLYLFDRLQIVKFAHEYLNEEDSWKAESSSM